MEAEKQEFLQYYLMRELEKCEECEANMGLFTRSSLCDLQQMHQKDEGKS